MLKGRECYGGLDLSSTTDISAFVLVFPPRDDEAARYYFGEFACVNFPLPGEQGCLRNQPQKVAASA